MKNSNWSKDQKASAAPAVRRMLRSRMTFGYYTGQGWTEQAREAKCFQDEMDAIREFIQKRTSDEAMKDVELVLRLPESDHDLFATPLPRHE